MVNRSYAEGLTIIAQAEAFTNMLQIYWMKNKMEIQVERDTNFLQSADGHLIIVQVSAFTPYIDPRHPLGQQNELLQ